MDQTLTASQRWFVRLLRCYPPSFRKNYGAHMAQVFGDSSREALSAAGARGLAGLWLATLPDVLKTAAQERLKEVTHSIGDKMTKLLSNPNFKTWAGFVLCLPLVISLMLDLLGVDQSWLSSETASTLSFISLALMLVGLWLLGAPALLSALLGLLSTLPFAAMELINRRSFAEEFPYALFIGLWLMGTLFAATLVPVVRQVRGNALAHAHLAPLVLRGTILLFIAIGWINLVADQMPCFLGVPVCD
ncbi:MAG: hypothetical protein KF701_02000 [Anaerolineales bacterium]|nr:MAG: hypothetical protein KF701_02000 [Anaerolineales bacterium]